MNQLTTMDAFVRVAEAGSFAEAARRWGRSKAVVSKYIAQLEQHLGVRLFQRTTRRLSLTDAGRSYLPRCQQILSLLAESESQLRAGHSAAAGELRITAPPGFMYRHRRAAISDFLRRYPAVSLTMDLSARMLDLVEERIDVAIRLTRPADSSLVARRLAPAPLVLVASPAHLAAAGAPRHPRELAGRPCLRDSNFRFHPRWPLRAGGRAIAVEVRGPVTVNSPLLVRELALDGLGIGLVPELLVEEDLAAGRLVELLPGSVDTSWSIWAVSSQRRLLPARARLFIEHLRRTLTR